VQAPEHELRSIGYFGIVSVPSKLDIHVDDSLEGRKFLFTPALSEVNQTLAYTTGLPESGVTATERSAAKLPTENE
jgi:hypothetical protein